MRAAQVNLNISEELENVAQTLSNEIEEVYIVNAGLMNVGKSSLFNALANQEDLFPVMDIPTTEVCKSVMLFEGVNLVDTPGIGARDADTEEARKAYRNADMILFIHNANTGELHEDEIKAINQIRKEFPVEQDFWRRFCLVISREDSKNGEGIIQIVEKTKLDIHKHCGGNDFPIYITSAVRYWKGVHQNKPLFIDKSGINQLKAFLFDNSQRLQAKSIELRQERLRARKHKEVAALETKRTIHMDKVTSLQVKYSAKMGRVEAELSRIQNGTRSLWENCRELANEVDSLY